jgi:pimeloyl-ACP methyl ester carboxylesterase/DNA-binding CsgD family transcriptional regulator
MRFLTGHFRFVRYDERGCGMTDWDVGELSIARWTEDLESVIETAAPARPAILLGMSQGGAACLSYAVRHPERVSHMVLYGAYARGVARRGNEAGEREYRAIIELVGAGWGRENPAFRQVFTSRFIPGGTAEQLAWFNELCRKTTSPAIAAELMSARAEIDVTGLLAQVRVPTLVIHAREDAVVPLAEGRLLASAIPGAQFIELDSRNHVLLEGEGAWQRFQDEVGEFLGVATPATEDTTFAALSPREREILARLTEGLSNAEIAERLGVSEKTVRNHLSHLFDKLGVWSRAQAMVLARDRGFKDDRSVR